MKSHKSQGTTSGRKKRASIKALKNYLDGEVTLIHENLDELKSFLSQHATMSTGSDFQTDPKNIDDYYTSADDLFKQVALETNSELPLEAKWYETLVLRKNKKKSSSKIKRK